ncbi:MAG: hypothetical protein H0T47_24560 [Planctomycetaceae bacterium]|nr:hypothetical protein [Planctomycetaceae bacterium]
MELSDEVLEGKITYKGQPVPYAMAIVTNGRDSATGTAANDGTYKVEYAPLGEVQIGVNTDAGQGMMMSAKMAGQHSDASKPAAKFTAVPKKYFEPTKSGITTTVTEKGPNHFDIVLE